MRAAALALCMSLGFWGCSSRYVLSLGGAGMLDSRDAGAAELRDAGDLRDAGEPRDAGKAREDAACGSACEDARVPAVDAGATDSGAACMGTDCQLVCRNDDDCPSDARTCDADLGFCIQCRSDSDCQETGAADRCIDHRCRE